MTDYDRGWWHGTFAMAGMTLLVGILRAVFA